MPAVPFHGDDAARRLRSADHSRIAQLGGGGFRRVRRPAIPERPPLDYGSKIGQVSLAVRNPYLGVNRKVVTALVLSVGERLPFPIPFNGCFTTDCFNLIYSMD